jgi:hypothetical protein
MIGTRAQPLYLVRKLYSRAGPAVARDGNALGLSLLVHTRQIPLPCLHVHIIGHIERKTAGAIHYSGGPTFLVKVGRVTQHNRYSTRITFLSTAD